MNKLKGTNLVEGKGNYKRAENDFYATDPKSVKALFDNYKIEGNSFYEPCCGMCHISNVIREYYPNAKIYETDLIYRGCGRGGIDFLNDDVFKNVLGGEKVDWIITNPPYSLAKEFVEKSLKLVNIGVAMFLKIQFLEGKGRKEFLKKSPLKYVYVFSERQNPLNNGMELNPKTGKKWQSTMCFAWFIWEIGYGGEPMIRWI